MSGFVEGQRITRVATLGSWFDMDSVALRDDEGNVYRMKLKEFLKVINGITFKKVKKRVHTYLEIVSFEERNGDCSNNL